MQKDNQGLWLLKSMHDQPISLKFYQLLQVTEFFITVKSQAMIKESIYANFIRILHDQMILALITSKSLSYRLVCLALQVILLLPNAFSQNRTIDSLQAELENSKSDTVALKLLRQISLKYNDLNPDSSLQYSLMALNLASSIGDKISIVNSHYLIGLASQSRYDYENAREHYQKAYDVLGEIDHSNYLTELKAKVRISQASNLEMLGQFSTSLRYQYEALLFSTDTEDLKTQAIIYSNLASTFSQINEYDSSMIYSLKALKLMHQQNDSIGIGRIYYNISSGKLSLNDNEGATHYILRAIDIAKKLQNAELLSKCFWLKGNIFQGQQMYDSAALFYRDALELSTHQNNLHQISGLYVSLGQLYFNQANYKKALESFLTALDLMRKLGDLVAGESCIYVHIAKVYRRQKDVQSAIKWAIGGLKIAEKLKSKIDARDASNLLSTIYEKLGNYQEAHHYLKLYHAYQNKIASEGKLMEISRIESRYTLDRIESEKNILEKEAYLDAETIRLQQQMILTAIFMSVLLLIIAILQVLRLRKEKLLVKKVKEQSSRLNELDQAKSQFFANISHDFRSPLTLILAGLDKISEKHRDILDNESKKLLDIGYKNGKRLLFLADEIMELIRLEEGKILPKLQLVIIEPYVKLLTKMFTSAAELKSIHLQFTSSIDDNTIINLDPKLFEKIIYNLLSNAIKFTPETGQVTVDLFSKNDHAYIKISNTGLAIPEESLEYIFDRFYQVKGHSSLSHAGSGIGLALVKELVEIHSGLIEVKSNSELTTFTVKIPLHKDTPAKAVIPEGSLDLIAKNTLWEDLIEDRDKLQIPAIANLDDAPSILIVEDHKELRYYLGSILEKHYKVHLAKNGAQALRVLDSTKIDLVLTDLMMPYMDGTELINKLKKDKELKKLPVLILSARTDHSEKIELLSMGADEILYKPFDKEEILARINNLLRRKWDSSKVFKSLHSDNIKEYEKSIMNRLEELIVRRIDDPFLSTDDLANEIASSQRKLYRVLKKICGLTPYELIKEVRWQYLERYLADNKIYNATQAAKLIGMGNVSSFSRQFKKRFGNSIKNCLAD